MTAIQPYHQQLRDISALNQTITLPDSRTLGYAEYGTLDGSPVFYFHGGNGSRLEAQWFSKAAEQNNIRLIAPDRPGFGLSDFQPNRKITDWNADVLALADALGIERFAVFGLSGGGPFVATLAHNSADRLTRAALVSCVAPPEAEGKFKGMWFPVRLVFLTARWIPGLNRFMLNQMGKFYTDPEKMRSTMIKGMPKPDSEFLTRVPSAVDIFSADATESHRQGVDGDAYEWQLYIRDWGFRIHDIRMEVGLWYGRYDTQVTPAMGKFYRSTLPNNVYQMVEDGGHFSTINNHIDAIFAYLTA